MTCGTTELSWSTGATKATTETKLRVQLVRANAFYLRLSCCFLLLVLLANCGIDHILKERRKRHEQSTKLIVHYKIYCNESSLVDRNYDDSKEQSRTYLKSPVSK